MLVIRGCNEIIYLYYIKLTVSITNEFNVSTKIILLG